MVSQEKAKIKYNNAIWKTLFKYFETLKKDFLKLTVFMTALAGLDIIFPLITQYTIDHLVLANWTRGLGIVACFYVALTLLLTAIVYFFIRHAGKLEMHLLYKMRKDCF